MRQLLREVWTGFTQLTNKKLESPSRMVKKISAKVGGAIPQLMGAKHNPDKENQLLFILPTTLQGTLQLYHAMPAMPCHAKPRQAMPSHDKQAKSVSHGNPAKHARPAMTGLPCHAMSAMSCMSIMPAMSASHA